MLKKTFKISGMDCVACIITIDGQLEETEGIQKAKTNYAKAKTEVNYDEEKISTDTIIKIIKKAGYEAVVE